MLQKIQALALQRKWELSLLFLFVVSRAVYNYLQIGFDYTSIQWYSHILDEKLLREELLESLYYLYIQPPLYNLFLGSIVKIAPMESLLFSRITHLVYLFLGILCMLNLYWVLRTLGQKPVYAAGAAFVFINLPDVVLYEKWLFYDYPIFTLLILSTRSALLLFSDAEKHGKHLLWLVLYVVLIVYMRSAFHLIWVVGLFGLVAWRIPLRPRSLAMLGLGFGLVFGLYLKNAVVFGNFGASSWLGINYVRKAPKRDIAIKSGTLSPYGRLDTNAQLATYQELMPLEDEYSFPEDIEVLHSAKVNKKSVNLNHYGYLKVYAQYKKDMKALLTEHPTTHLSFLRAGIGYYFRPTTDYAGFALNGNTKKLAGALKLQQFLAGAFVFGKSRFTLFSFLVYLLALSLGGVLLVRRWPQRGASFFFTLFLLYLITYTFAVSVNFELFENMRQRFYTDVLVFILAVQLALTWNKK